MATADRSDSRTVPATAVRATGLAAGLGTVIFWSPVLTTEVGTLLYLNLPVGFVIAAVASYNALIESDRGETSLLLNAALVVLGVWVVASVFIFGTTNAAMLWLSSISGALVALLGVYGVVVAIRRS